MAIASLQAKIRNAQRDGDAAKVAEYRRKLAVIVGAARDERQQEIREDTKSMQLDFRVWRW